jgi:hypothetical protein
LFVQDVKSTSVHLISTIKRITRIYPYCRDNGWKLFFRMDLHAKTYVFDRLRCIIGSANATGNGMNIGGSGNYEMATACELADKDVRALDLLLRGAVEMDDTIYNIMKSTVEEQHTIINHSTQWPKEITGMFRPDYSLLFAEDFPSCPHPATATNDDLLFLNISLIVKSKPPFGSLQKYCHNYSFYITVDMYT